MTLYAKHLGTGRTLQYLTAAGLAERPCPLTPGRSLLEKMGDVGSKWLANLLYSRPLALKNKYRCQPMTDCIARKPQRNQRNFCSATITSDSSLLGTNTCSRGHTHLEASVHCHCCVPFKPVLIKLQGLMALLLAMHQPAPVFTSCSCYAGRQNQDTC